MKKFVWDTSAILNIKEPDDTGYSPGHSLFKDLADGWIPGPYQNIFPAISAFEVDASVSRMYRDGRQILREFYIVNEHSVVYPIDRALITRCATLVTKEGFSKLRGADLIFACIAYIEGAYLVTLDNHFKEVAQEVQVINLDESRASPAYRHIFGI